MSNFITDNTPLYDDKVDPNPVTIPTQQWAAADAALVKGALLDIRSFLQSGIGGVGTFSDLNVVANTLATVGPEADWVGYNGDWFIGIDVANAPTSRDFVLTGCRETYSFPDGATTNGSPTLTSPSGGGFATSMIGSVISGAVIPSSTTVIAVAGPTSLTMSANALSTTSGLRVTVTRNTVKDLAYWKHRGALSPTLGIGVTPPDGTARLQVSGQDDEIAMGTLRLRTGPAQTGKPLTVHDSAPTDRWWIDKDFFMSGNHGLGGAVFVQADLSNGRAVVVTDNAKVNFYGLTFPGGNLMCIRNIGAGFDILNFESNGGLRHASTRLGFYNTAPIVKPAATGSRGGNAALASLLTQLANLGLITDSTTA